MKFDYARSLLVGVLPFVASGMAGVLLQSAPIPLSAKIQLPAIAAVPPAIVTLPTATLAGTQPQKPLAQAIVARKVESCLIQMAIINDPNPPLNVRSAPTTQNGKVVMQLNNGTRVTVTEDKNDWFRITVPINGWIAKQRTTYSCNQKVERLTIAPSKPMAIGDRFIGGGTHKYRLSASKGQKLTITRKDGPFPTIIAPDGKILVGNPPDEIVRSGAGNLPRQVIM